MADDSTIRQSFELPSCKVIFEFRPRVLSYEFQPELPNFGNRTQALEFVKAYVAARREFLETVATATGLRLAVIDELPDGSEAISAPIAPASFQ